MGPAGSESEREFPVRIFLGKRDASKSVRFPERLGKKTLATFVPQLLSANIRRIWVFGKLERDFRAVTDLAK